MVPVLMAPIPKTLLAAALLGLAACHPADPCPGCEGNDIVDSGTETGGESERPPPDLPCGDVNLWTDDLNCGACGRVCPIVWPGTQYEAGHCIEGECGPTWSELFVVSELDPRDCDELCESTNTQCTALGCSGMTALVCLSEYGGFWDPWSTCEVGDLHYDAYMKFTGDCQAKVPHPNVFEVNAVPPEVDVFTRCCCAP